MANKVDNPNKIAIPIITIISLPSLAGPILVLHIIRPLYFLLRHARRNQRFGIASHQADLRRTERSATSQMFPGKLSTVHKPCNNY
jgi:hypothetical protein